MKLLISFASVFIVAIISCGGSTSEADRVAWDDYRSQIDNWQAQVNEKLAEADELLKAGPMDDDGWLSSVNELGIEIDSITLAVTTLDPPSGLQDFHDSFVLASDFYKLAGRLLAEHFGDSEEDRAAIMKILTNEIAFGEANMLTVQSIFDEAVQKRDR